MTTGEGTYYYTFTPPAGRWSSETLPWEAFAPADGIGIGVRGLEDLRHVQFDVVASSSKKSRKSDFYLALDWIKILRRHRLPEFVLVSSARLGAPGHRIDDDKKLYIPPGEGPEPGREEEADALALGEWGRLYWTHRTELALANSGLAYCIVRAPPLVESGPAIDRAGLGADRRGRTAACTRRELSEVVRGCLGDEQCVGQTLYVTREKM